MSDFKKIIRSLSQPAAQSILSAVEEATAMGTNWVDAEHLLLGLVKEENGCVQVLRKLGVSPEDVGAAIAASYRLSQVSPREPTLSPKAIRAVEMAVEEARQMNCQYVAPEHLLLGLLRLKTDNSLLEFDLEYIPRTILFMLGLASEEKLKERKEARSQGHPPFQSKLATQVLDRFNLNAETTRIVVMDALETRNKHSLWTEKTRRIVTQSQKEARLTGSGRISNGHLLLALIQDGESIATQMLEQELQARGASLDVMQVALKAVICSDNEMAGSKPKFTPGAKRAFRLAAVEAKRLHHKYIGPEHLLLGILPSKRDLIRERLQRLNNSFGSDDVVAQALSKIGLDACHIRTQVTQHLGYPSNKRTHPSNF